jgi:hypothetical protein
LQYAHNIIVAFYLFAMTAAPGATGATPVSLPSPILDYTKGKEITKGLDFLSVSLFMNPITVK